MKLYFSKTGEVEVGICAQAQVFATSCSFPWWMVLERILLSWSFDIDVMSFCTPSKDSRLSASTSRMSAAPLHHIEIRDSGYFLLRSLYGQSCWNRRKTSNNIGSRITHSRFVNISRLRAYAGFRTIVVEGL